MKSKTISERIKQGLRDGTIPSDYGTLELAEFAYSQALKDFLEYASGKAKLCFCVTTDDQEKLINGQYIAVPLSDLEAILKNKGEE